MWTDADVTVEIDQVDRDVMIVIIGTPVGKLQLIGEITRGSAESFMCARLMPMVCTPARLAVPASTQSAESCW